MKRMLTLTSLFIFVGTAGAQAPAKNPSPFSPFGGSAEYNTRQSRPPASPAKKSALETAIDLALANNPDLRVAEAKVREAEASMSRTRLQVLQKVVTAYQGIEDAKATLKHAEIKLANVKRLHTNKVVSAEEVQLAETAVSAAKSREAAAQAELDYLQAKAAKKSSRLGGSGSAADAFVASGYFRLTDSVTYGVPLSSSTYSYTLDRPRVEGPSADRLRKSLEKKVTVKMRGTDARAYLDFLLEQAPGLHIQAAEKGPGWDEKVTANLSEVPLSAALQLLEDVLGEHRIVVRDYGLLIVTKSHVPPGATTLADFLRAGTTETKPASKPGR